MKNYKKKNSFTYDINVKLVILWKGAVCKSWLMISYCGNSPLMNILRQNIKINEKPFHWAFRCSKIFWSLVSDDDVNKNLLLSSIQQNWNRFHKINNVFDREIYKNRVESEERTVTIPISDDVFTYFSPQMTDILFYWNVLYPLK